MATKPSKAAPKKRPIKRSSRFNNWFAIEERLKTFGIVSAVILIACAGSYFIVAGRANQKDDNFTPKFVDQPARGVIWSGSRIATAGPCKDMIEVETVGDKKSCAHTDPGPEGIDVRERVKDVDKGLAALAAMDEKQPPKASDDPNIDDTPPATEPVTADDKSWPGSLGQFVAPRNWPCVGTTGVDGPRVQMVYVYVSGTTNRLSTLRPGFEAIAKRMNAVMYNSGGGKQIRFATIAHSDGTCGLSIGTVAIPSSSVNSFSAINTALKNAGYTSNSRKFVAWVDGGTPCGTGELWPDNSPGATNNNNIYRGLAVVWKPCWNYSEPHELMHTLGGVQAGAPHETGYNHCYDQHDEMCYDDGSGRSMVIVAACTYRISYRKADGTYLYSDKYAWLYDCRHDDYFNAAPAAGSYLATHWNTATSKFLYPNTR